MKILFLSACSQLGGAERTLLDLLASLCAADRQLSLHLITTENGPLVSECQRLGVSATVVKLPERVARLGDATVTQERAANLLNLLTAGPALVTYLLRLRHVIRSVRPDIVHTNGFKMHVLGVLAKPRRASLVWHMHDFVSSRPVMARLLRLFAIFASLAVANSESVAADVRTVCGSRTKVKTVHNAVDLERFTAAGGSLDLDSLSGMRPSIPDTVKIGLIATLARWKGHETFLRAVSLLPRDVPVRAYIVGDAIYRTNGSQYSLVELRALAREFGVADRVGFAGFISDTATAMRTLDIVVHASTQPEPFGLVIAEAAACGKAIIATDRAGATELMKDGTDFLSYRATDPISLATRLLGLALSAQIRRQLGTAARATAERVFDRTRLANDLLPLYRSLAPESSMVTRRETGTPEFAALTSDI